jgi:excisionase family DNA binding protein
MSRAVPDELTVLAAAALVRRSPETVRRWVWSGRLRARKSGKRLLVPRRDVESLAGIGPRSLTLKEWGELAEQVLRRPKTRGRSASDLVLADRRERSERIDARR